MARRAKTTTSAQPKAALASKQKATSQPAQPTGNNRKRKAPASEAAAPPSKRAKAAPKTKASASTAQAASSRKPAKAASRPDRRPKLPKGYVYVSAEDPGDGDQGGEDPRDGNPGDDDPGDDDPGDEGPGGDPNPPDDNGDDDGDDDEEDDGGDDDDDDSSDSSSQDENPDESYRLAAIEQFKALKLSRRNFRAKEIANLLPFLETMTLPASDKIQYTAAQPRRMKSKQLDAYILSKEDAHILLKGTKSIHAPVFILGGAPDVCDSSSRPIEQALNTWFLDPLEDYTFHDSQGKERTPNIQKMREHFLSPDGNGEQDKGYPWNLRDILNPMAQQCLPTFAQSLNCNLLRDIYRIILQVNDELICPADCPKRTKTDQCCDGNGHEITFNELFEVTAAAREHEGTLMISDPGSITGPHWDRWCLGTYISCHEGEMGFAWLSHPSTIEQHKRWTDTSKNGKPEGNWLFKVFRKGDAVYMPPGTVHVVFRLPEGQQTMATAGHFLRRSTDWKNWLKMLVHERETHIVREQEEAGSGYLTIFGPIVKTLRFLLDQVKSDEEIERFGGKRRVKSARKLLATLEGQVSEILATIQ
ncbi:hypothetical protein CKM354_000938300 [Cercospora kikuchii]|uniref:JmjC domain-containing protein n=1 Tax=Cercospora kikuchii TaxID=84275 RepID=A0A9P3CPG1_9PEZI|nr:uncharacterized protein CKM354_000938300 [Cercospora kikuchii]GIZ46251.1 hypothetical protein CKM354_000938300 [Cercospora kikuchii]